MVKKLIYKNINEINGELLINNEVYIYGASKGGITTYLDLINRGITIHGVIDSDSTKKGKNFMGYSIKSCSELSELSKEVIIVIGTRVEKFIKEIIEYLNRNEFFYIYAYAHNNLLGSGEFDIHHLEELIKFNSIKIDEVYRKLADSKSKQVFMNLLQYRKTNDQRFLDLSYENSHKQYFPKNEIFNCDEHEVFIDAGGYDGQTVSEFMDYVSGKYKHIYTLEPDSIMKEVIKTRIVINEWENVNLIEKGLYHSSTQLKFYQDYITGSSSINNEGTKIINTTSLDHLNIDKVTFVKMDIEGAEIEALDGAKMTIARDMPKLAISIYHKPDDLWEIPYKLLCEYPKYKLFMRHYTSITTETVCYATL